jgi:hypothetical protein
MSDSITPFRSRQSAKSSVRRGAAEPDTCQCWHCLSRRRHDAELARAEREQPDASFLAVRTDWVAFMRELESCAPRCSLHPSDERHPYGFVFDQKTLEGGTLDIWWGGYEYWIELERINTPERFLGLLNHIGRKTWAGATPDRVAELITLIARHFAWNIYGW